MREVVQRVGSVVFRYQSLTPDEVAAWKADLARDATCPTCGQVAVIVEQWDKLGVREAGTLYLHGRPTTNQPPVPSCWVPDNSP